MEPTRPRFTYLINENILLDRTADRCLQPVIFLSRLLLGDKSVKVYKIGSNGKIKDDLPSSNQTSIIHTCCMCILSSIALIPGILVGGGLKWWSYCTPQHKKDCDLLDKFLIENDSKDKKKDVILNTTNSTTTPLSISSIPATLPIESIIKAEIKPMNLSR